MAMDRRRSRQGRPGSASGSGADLDDCKAALKAAWAVILADLTRYIGCLCTFSRNERGKALDLISRK